MNELYTKTQFVPFKAQSNRASVRNKEIRPPEAQRRGRGIKLFVNF